jgi:CDP-glucose 4,6-dehydratase
MAEPADTPVRPPFGGAMAGRRVLVTGASGFLGGALTRRVLELGAEVAVLEREPSPSSLLVLEGLADRCERRPGDVTDAELVDRAVAGCDTVFHLAAQPIVGTANRSPRETFEVNVRGTWNVLEACRAAGTERVVVASSDNAYGPGAGVPYREDSSPLHAARPYDASKAAADVIARSYWTAFGVPVATTRLGNVYGGGDRNTTRLVPGAIRELLAGRRPVIRSDGSPLRDLLYVEDAVEAYLAVADLLDAGPARGAAFNAGGGQPHRVLDVVRALCAVAGADVEPVVQGAGTPPGERTRQYVDSGRLHELTGWSAKVGLEEGLARTLAWYREHPAALSG